MKDYTKDAGALLRAIAAAGHPQAQYDAIAAALRAAREDGLEEAALLIEEMGKSNRGVIHSINVAEAKNIRALKEGGND